jgi:hypothetical protein
MIQVLLDQFRDTNQPPDTRYEKRASQQVTIAVPRRRWKAARNGNRKMGEKETVVLVPSDNEAES